MRPVRGPAAVDVPAGVTTAIAANAVASVGLMPPRPGRTAAAVTAVGGAAVAAGAAVRQGRNWLRNRRAPVRPEAITPETARDRAAVLLALPRIRRRDEALTFAPTVATSVEILLHGRRYFPRMLEDIAAAQDHVHMLFYAFKPGTTADAFVDALAERAAAGLEVKVAVDAVGSAIDFDEPPPLRPAPGGRRPGGRRTTGSSSPGAGSSATGRSSSTCEDALHFDHRKMIVIDGRIAYVGGTGIEDHFADGRFADAMCRVTGPIVSQVQLAILTSWAKDGGAAAARPRRAVPRRGRPGPGRRPPGPRGAGPDERAGHRPSPDPRRDLRGARRGAIRRSTWSTRTSRTGA